jgi:aerobic carbon-monoxide dehydrogenase medium subunit
MKPAPFRYFAPRSLEEALHLLAEHGDDAKPLAGGQSLVPAMNFRLARPGVLVDLNGVEELAYVTPRNGGGVRVGAMTRQRTAERDPLLHAGAPLLVEALGFVAHPQIRNRGTIGGSLAHADPAAELPAIAVALGAELTLSSTTATRTVSARDFYTGLFATALEPGELLTEVCLPLPPPRTGAAFEEVSRRHGDYALVGVAAVVSLDDSHRMAATTLCYLSVADTPFLATEATVELTGASPSAARFDEATRRAADSADPGSDIHASNAFRRHLMRVLGARALQHAARRAAAP